LEYSDDGNRILKVMLAKKSKIPRHPLFLHERAFFPEIV